jgi:hypothetical protein
MSCGRLVEIEEGSILRFRCHTGHAFSLKTLLADVNAAIDTGLWDTLRAVEERILLLNRMEELARKSVSLRRRPTRSKRQSASLNRCVLCSSMPRCSGTFPRTDRWH